MRAQVVRFQTCITGWPSLDLTGVTATSVPSSETSAVPPSGQDVVGKV